MNIYQNLLHHISSWRQNRQIQIRQAINWSKWLPTPGNIISTVLIAGLLIFTQQTWANNTPDSVDAPGPSATTINYQGNLTAPNGAPQNGSFDMSFAIYNAASGGTYVWGPETHNAVPVSNGIFNIGLGSKTSGGIPTTVWNGDRYLQITVGGETLTPRELIRSVPIAGLALTVPVGAIGTAQIVDGSVTPSDINFPFGSKCLTQTTTMNIISGQENPIPELDLTFNLNNASNVMVWIDGLANLSALQNGSHANIWLEIDDTNITGSNGSQSQQWSNLKGQRIINLGAGSHTIGAVGWGGTGDVTLYGPEGSEGVWQVCVYYLVLDEQ